MDLEKYENPPVRLNLEAVVGRRAFDRRNNVKIDCQDRICFVAASLIVFMEENKEYDERLGLENDHAKFKQTFLRPDPNPFTSVSPEVSTFTLAQDKRILVIGTAQVEA